MRESPRSVFSSPGLAVGALTRRVRRRVTSLSEEDRGRLTFAVNPFGAVSESALNDDVIFPTGAVVDFPILIVGLTAPSPKAESSEIRDVFDFVAESRGGCVDGLIDGGWIVGGRMDCGGDTTDCRSLVESSGRRIVFRRIVGAPAACASVLPVATLGVMEIGFAGASG